MNSVIEPPQATEPSIPLAGIQVFVEARRELREAVIADLALEPVYLSRITGSLSLPVEIDVDEFLRWRFELEPKWLLDWLAVDATWIRARASQFLGAAQQIDQLGSWSEVIGAGSVRRWDQLRGTPRLVMDMRLAGELLLRYYDRLANEKLAEPIPKPLLTRTPYDLRLKRRRPLDALLTEFGLSPHPQLILIVEGPTERLIVPRVMEKVGLPSDADFIAIQDAEGVNANLNALLAYLAPQPGEIESDRYVRPLRPLTRFLVVFDPEPPLVTDAHREERRKIWVERIFRGLPREIQTPVVRKQMDDFVSIRTWNEEGDSFEFAHFTDQELARAIDRLDRRPNKPPLERLLELVGEFRRNRKNLRTLLHSFSKVELAEELWPVLEQRLETAIDTETGDEIPVAGIIYEAAQLAQQFGRGNTVIALNELPQSEQ